MKTNTLIFGLVFSVLTSSAFALPAVDTVHNEMSKATVVAEGGTKHTNVGSIRVAADGADRVGPNRQAAMVLITSVQIVWPLMVPIASVQTVKLLMVQTMSVQTAWPLMGLIVSVQTA